MNKNICLLVFACLLVATLANEQQSMELESVFQPKPTIKAPKVGGILNWWTNQNDWLMTVFTVMYCFNVGFFNIFNYNDGGLSLYTCLESYVKTITYA